MNNDQRLIPFLGGLVIGGAVGNHSNQIPYYNNYYPSYYYPYPIYNTYPYYNNQIQYPSQMPINSTNYDYNAYPNNMSYPVVTSNDERSIYDPSFVPPYINK